MYQISFCSSILYIVICVKRYKRHIPIPLYYLSSLVSASLFAICVNLFLLGFIIKDFSGGSDSEQCGKLGCSLFSYIH